jgi:hypothetical protein
MKKITLFLLLFLSILMISCSLPQQKKEPFCGDDICQDNEKESGCAADCGGFEGITKLQCTQAKGNWNDCGSPCAGTGAEYCIEICQPQCECGGIAGFGCPGGYKCRLTGRIADELGVCIRTNN